MGVGIPTIPPVLVWKSCTLCCGLWVHMTRPYQQAGGPHSGARGTLAHLGSSGFKLQGHGLTVLPKSLHPTGWSPSSLAPAIKPVPIDLGCLGFQPLLSLQRITMVTSSWLSQSSANSPSVLCAPTSVENTSSDSAIPLPTI